VSVLLDVLQLVDWKEQLGIGWHIVGYEMKKKGS